MDNKHSTDNEAHTNPVAYAMRMEQGTSEWLAWRRQGIGASESAALLGVCPYKTPFQLYTEKSTGAQLDTEAAPGLFQRGHETEAQVRAEYELETGEEYAPALFEHPEYPFIRASLDGWNAETRQGIEIKMVGAKYMGEPIPPHHIIQMQHQMLVTATDTWTYLRHCEGKTQKMQVTANPGLQAKILAACWQFWSDLQAGKAPAYTDRDWVPSFDENLDLALRSMLEQTTTAKRAPYRAEALRLAPARRVVNMVEGPAKGVKVCTDPARITVPKEG